MAFEHPPAALEGVSLGTNLFRHDMRMRRRVALFLYRNDCSEVFERSIRTCLVFLAFERLRIRDGIVNSFN
jgi:hypothetical protein